MGSRCSLCAVRWCRGRRWARGRGALLMATGLVTVLGVQLPLAGAGAGRGMATAAAAPAGTLSFPLAWSVGPLPDAGAPIAEGSPGVAILDGGGPSVVVGDRAGRVYAYHLSGGAALPGWPVDAEFSVDSTPSVAQLAGRFDSVFVGAGDAIDPRGGYQAWGAAGNRLWSTTPANPPEDLRPETGVQASLAVGDLQGGTDVFAGSLGQEAYGLDASTGRALTGWPFFASDSDFSTAALADLYGTGQLDIVEGGDQTAGIAFGQSYRQGGHLRIFNPRGGLICDYHTDQTVDSSPAVGDFLAGGAAGIVVGTGAFFAGASDTDTVKAFNADCQLQWSARLDGATGSSPALADVEGDGRLDAVEGTDRGTGGSVWVLDAATGRTVWERPVISRVIGSVVTADLTGQGYQDLLVPTIHGVEVLDGRSGAEVTVLGSLLGFQNAPLVTDDPGGVIGITIAGYDGDNRGVIDHFEIPGSDGALAVGSGSWPQFHQGPALNGTTGGRITPWPSCLVPSAARPGYETVAADGGIFAFGQPFCGSTGGQRLHAPVVGMTNAPDRGGYWLVASDGGVFSFGGAGFYGSLGGIRLTRPVVGMAATPDGRGYWLVASDGGVFAFGDATFYGSTGKIRLRSPARGLAPTADGRGYLLVAADGGVFRFGDALFFGSMGGRPLQKPVVGIAIDGATGGYWLVAADGGIFAFDAPFYGSTGHVRLVRPIVGMQPTLDGRGYRLVAADGGIFDFGDAGFYGSVGGVHLNRPMVGMSGS